MTNRILTGDTNENTHMQNYLPPRRPVIQYAATVSSSHPRNRPVPVRVADDPAAFSPSPADRGEKYNAGDLERRPEVHGDLVERRTLNAGEESHRHRDVQQQWKWEEDVNDIRATRVRYTEENSSFENVQRTLNDEGAILNVRGKIGEIRQNAQRHHKPKRKYATERGTSQSPEEDLRSAVKGPRRGYVDDATGPQRSVSELGSLGHLSTLNSADADHRDVLKVSRTRGRSSNQRTSDTQRSQNDQTRYLQFRITTRRPTTRPTGILLDNLQPSYVPRYIKEDITEVEYEPRLVTTHKVDPHWFLMPVQAWFVLSIVLAALFIVLVVIVVLLYRTIRKQKKKIRKLVISSRCGDPLHHEMCNCRRGISVASPYLGPLGRSLDGLGTLGRPIDGTLGRPIDGRYNGELSGTLQLAATTCRDSAVSRNSLRGATLANSKTKDSPAHLATLQRGSLQRATLQRGSNFHAQSYDQPTTINIGNGRRLQTTDMIEHDRDALRDNNESDDCPPPLAPKTVQSHPQTQQSLQQQQGQQHQHEQHFERDRSLRGITRCVAPDVHLTTLYPPPPGRFHF